MERKSKTYVCVWMCTYVHYVLHYVAFLFLFFPLFSCSHGPRFLFCRDNARYSNATCQNFILKISNFILLYVFEVPCVHVFFFIAISCHKLYRQTSAFLVSIYFTKIKWKIWAVCYSGASETSESNRGWLADLFSSPKPTKTTIVSEQSTEPTEPKQRIVR